MGRSSSHLILRFIYILMIQGYTPLHIACEFNQAATVKLLLQRGADAYFRDPDDMLPIENAIVNCSRDCIVELIGSVPSLLRAIYACLFMYANVL